MIKKRYVNKRRAHKKPRHLVHLISSLEVGGAQAVLLDLVQSFKSEGYRQSIVYFHDGLYLQRFRDLGVNIVPVRGFLCTYDPLFFLRLFFVIWRLKPDVMHSLLWAANCCAYVVCFVLRVPLVSVLHNNASQNGVLRNSIEKILAPLSGSVVAVSDEVKKTFHVAVSPQKKVLVIKNGIAVKKIIDQAAGTRVLRSDLGLKESDFVFGFVGRFVVVKNIPLLLSAFKKVLLKVPNAKLVLVGAGPLEQEIRVRIRQLGIHDAVRLVVGKQALDYYSLFDCFVQTSQQEGISIALLEAMSCELACIVANESSTHCVIEHGVSGVVVPRATPCTFGAAMVQMINTPEHVKKMGREAQRYVLKHYQSETMCQEYGDLITKLIDSGIKERC